MGLLRDEIETWRQLGVTEEELKMMENQANSVNRDEDGVPYQTKARNSQVGGGHYTKLKIQPLEYSYQNNLGAAEHTVIKYVTRWRDKGGVEDLRKARHTLDLLIEMVESSVNRGEENE